MENGVITTVNEILGHRVALEQPKVGYRVAIDTVFLAASVPALEGERVLDLGCGVGGAMLCLACRVRGLTGGGIESQEELVAICRRNIARNAFASQLEVWAADARQPPLDFYESFDHVAMNPPYHGEASHDVSSNIIRKTANTEAEGDLPLWIAAANAVLKLNGTLTLIHRADRLEEILYVLRPSFGEIEILKLLSKAGTAAKRAIVRARKGALFSVREMEPLTLHEETGAYTKAAENVLRHAKAAMPLNAR